MVFAVSPPWGPWSDNIVPLVRLSRCLIRTASGASPTPASGSPLSGLRRRVRTLEKETKDLDSIEVFLLLPREPGIRMQERLMGDSGPRLQLSTGDGPRSPACGPEDLSAWPAWSLDPSQLGREHPQAGQGASYPCGGAQTGEEPLPRPLCSQWLPFIIHV